MGAHETASSARGLDAVSRRTMLRWSALVGGSALAAGVAPRRLGAASSLQPSGGCAGSLPSALAAVLQKPRYARSTWSLLVADVATGEVLYALRPDQMALTGSVRKLYSVGLALRRLGPDHRFETTVCRQGTLDAQGVLQGIRVVTDPRAEVDLRRRAFLLRVRVFNRYGEGGWECTDFPPEDGQTPVGGIFLKQSCAKLVDNARRVLVRAHFFRKAGQTGFEADGRRRQGDFESSTRFEILSLAVPIPP